ATLRPPAGPVPTWEDGTGVRWIRARAEWAPRMTLRQLPSPAAVDAQEDAGDAPQTYVWAWEDEAAGRVRARSFAPGLGIPEDEATGAAAVLLGAALGRELEIRQGVGSRLLARPGPDGTVGVGGTVTRVEVRDHAVWAAVVWRGGDRRGLCAARASGVVGAGSAVTPCLQRACCGVPAFVRLRPTSGGGPMTVGIASAFA